MSKVFKCILLQMGLAHLPLPWPFKTLSIVLYQTRPVIMHKNTVVVDVVIWQPKNTATKHIPLLIILNVQQAVV